MNIISHAEKYLGKVSRGWKGSGASASVQIVSFEDSPLLGVDVLMTLGLSHHELMISSEKNVRQELILPVSGAEWQRNGRISCIFYLIDLILGKHKALLRGQVIRFPAEALEEIGFDAVYCAMPVFLADDFATFDASDPPTVIVWLLPIYASEVEFIELNGWEMFEDLLEQKDPDLFLIGRITVA